ARFIPRIPGASADRSRRESVSHPTRELNHRRLADQDRAGRAQLRYHRRIVIEFLIREWPRAPRGRIAFDREQIFRRIRNSVERASVLSRSNLSVGLSRFAECEVAS